MNNNKTFVNYVTKPHDTLPSICAKFNSTPYRLRQLNPQTNLDEIKPGQTLLIEITRQRKGSDDSPSPFKKNPTFSDDYPDMTFQRKPLFVQVRQVEYKYIDTDGMEEFERSAPPKVDYSDLNIRVKLSFQTHIGNVPGELLIAQQLVFTPDTQPLIDLLLTQTIRRERDINDEVIERYSFKLNMDDLYLIRQEGTDKLEIYVFGVLGVDPPLKDGLDNYGVIKVVLIQSQPFPQAIEEQFRTYIQKSSRISDPNMKNLQLLIELLNQILSTELYQDQSRLFQEVLKKAILYDKLGRKKDSKVKMQCFSQISLYDIVPARSMENYVLRDKRLAQNLYKKQKLPVLKQPTEILDIVLFEQILKSIPEYLQNNEWYLMYSPTKHGTSYDELIRRCSMIGPHVLVIKDNHDRTFGAFLPENWTREGDKYYGTSETFVFTFNNKKIKVFEWTKINDGFQMCNEEGLHIGADERPAITIHYELLRGSSFPCETFKNDILAGDYNFKIIEMEFWGLSENCEILQRALRQQVSFFGNDF